MWQDVQGHVQTADIPIGLTPQMHADAADTYWKALDTGYPGMLGYGRHYTDEAG